MAWPPTHHPLPDTFVDHVDDIMAAHVNNLGTTANEIVTKINAVVDDVAAVPITSFIYNSSGGTGPARYDDWADLMTAIGAVDGPYAIQFEQVETIPSGTWDLTLGTLNGNGVAATNGGIYAVLDEGCEFVGSGSLNVDKGFGLLQSGSTPSLPLGGTGEFAQVIFGNGAGAATVGTEPLIQIASGNNGVIALPVGGQLTPLGGYPVVDLIGTAECYIACQTGSIVNDDAISGSGVVVYVIQASGALLSYNQPNFSGTLDKYVFTNSANVGYTPTTSSDWDSTNYTVQSALDELAARVRALEP